MTRPDGAVFLRCKADLTYHKDDPLQQWTTCGELGVVLEADWFHQQRVQEEQNAVPLLHRQCVYPPSRASKKLPPSLERSDRADRLALVHAHAKEESAGHSPVLTATADFFNRATIEVAGHRLPKLDLCRARRSPPPARTGQKHNQHRVDASTTSLRQTPEPPRHGTRIASADLSPWRYTVWFSSPYHVHPREDPGTSEKSDTRESDLASCPGWFDLDVLERVEVCASLPGTIQLRFLVLPTKPEHRSYTTSVEGAAAGEGYPGPDRVLFLDAVEVFGELALGEDGDVAERKKEEVVPLRGRQIDVPARWRLVVLDAHKEHRKEKAKGESNRCATM